MAATQKTLMDMFTPVAKRLKKDSSSSSSSSLSPISTAAVTASSSSLSPEQKSRAELNQLKAQSKLNLKSCLDTVSNSFNSSSPGGSVPLKLEKLLVEKTWLEALPGEFEKPYAKDLCRFVESEIHKSSDVSKNGVIPVYPPLHLIFNALNSTPFDKVKVVIIGQDPYHGPGQAMGLSFSVPDGIKVPSSLVNIYKELHQDLGCSIPHHGNLERWAFQGVLLLNAVLTVRKHQANSHAKKGWEQFTDAVIEAISQKREGVVFLLWGNYAQAKSRLIDGNKHHILKAAHPSGLSANRGFFGCRHFSCTNKLLEKMGMSTIDWQL